MFHVTFYSSETTTLTLHKLYRKNNSRCDFSPVFLFFKSLERARMGELAEAPSQMLVQRARNITIEVLCEGKSKWVPTHT